MFPAVASHGSLRAHPAACLGHPVTLTPSPVRCADLKGRHGGQCRWADLRVPAQATPRRPQIRAGAVEGTDGQGLEVGAVGAEGQTHPQGADAAGSSAAGRRGWSSEQTKGFPGQHASSPWALAVFSVAGFSSLEVSLC